MLGYLGRCDTVVGMKKLVELEGVKMEQHEKDAILRLRKLGFNAKPLLPAGASHTPDVVAGNQCWEIC